MKRLFNTILFCFCISVAGMAQNIRISGLVKDTETNTPAEFANVVLQTKDSTFVTGISTDAKGCFQLDKIQKGDYRLIVSAIGYTNCMTELEGLSGSLDLGELLLYPEAVTLNDVVVTASNVVNKSDRKVVFPTDKQVKASTNGVNLLQSMQLSRIQVDPITNGVSLAGNEELQLRINGVEVSNKEIASLQPADILRIEYQESPGLRYGNAGGVLNYITRRHETGGSIGLDLLNSPHVLFGEDQVSARLNHKKSEFGMTYSLGARDFTHYWRDNEELFRYEDGSELRRTEAGKPGRYTRQSHNLMLNYNYQKPDNYMFNATFNYGADEVPHADFRSELSSSQYPDDRVNMTDLTGESVKRPSLDLYYMHYLKNRQTLVFNLVGTYIHSNRSRLYREEAAGHFLTDVSSDIKGQKYSLIAEGIYENEFKAGLLSAGLKHNQSFSDNTYSGTMNYLTTMKQSDTYLYAEFAGKVKLLDYSAGVGLNRAWFKQKGEKEYERYVFRPRISLRYAFSNHLYARISSRIEHIQPSLSELSAVEQLIDSMQIQRGNPTVTPYKQYWTDLYAEYSTGKFTIAGNASYINLPNPIMASTYRENNLFVRTFENQRRWQKINGEITLKASNLWNILYLSVTGGITQTLSDGNNYSHKYTNWYYRASVFAMYKKWVLAFDIANNRNDIWGETVRGGENMHTLMVMYKLKNVTLGAGALNPFMDNFKVIGENRNQYASNLRTTYANETSRLFILKCAWNFTFGRKYKSDTKKINNQDTDAGIMNAGK